VCVGWGEGGLRMCEDEDAEGIWIIFDVVHIVVIRGCLGLLVVSRSCDWHGWWCDSGGEGF
jgi:hypothetical protein